MPNKINGNLKNKKQACKPGPVIMQAWVPIIYLDPESLRDSSDLPLTTPGIHRNQGGQPRISKWRNSDVHGLTTHEAYGYQCCHLYRWALTPPFHPYPRGRLFSVILLYPRGYLPVRKHGALCCPDFPPHPKGAAIERPAFAAKVVRISEVYSSLQRKFIKRDL